MDTWTCPYCNNTLEYKNKYTKSGHLARCGDWKEWRDNTLTESFLREQYCEKGKSTPQIAEELDMNGHSAIIGKLKEFNIRIRDVSEANKMEKARERYKKSCLEKFGAPHNLHSDSPHRDKMVERLKEKYGVENVFQLESVIEKSKQTKKEKYGARNLWELEWYRNKIIPEDRYSNIHKKVYQFIKNQLGVNVENEFPINIIDGSDDLFLYDIHIKDTNKLIEVHGDYWHCNPKFYSKNDVFHFPKYKITAEGQWEKDNFKNERARELGYELLVVWEDEIKNEWPIVKRKIKKYLNYEN